MKKGILITIIGIVIIGIGYFGLQMFDLAKGVKEDIGKNFNRNLILVLHDYEIDLTDLDSVRENLNGFWIPEKDINGKEILWLDFHKTKNSSTWELIPYNEEIKRNESITMNSSSTIVSLIKENGETQMEFVSLVGLDTTEIEKLSKTKFKIDGITYLRHKGYDFLETWNVHGYESEK
ncbi:hypothetical protein EAX61_01295 [Dokdonia sinensis]|uniref:Uncharacterized protein n=1 Tax=Dokdonia sinensis TaxID=2479847 RepID=A0A3M0GHA6_9FLAO|nr:hypothetical protein [Dokdonia sinensis]RMB64044.1 hypothetical protein EAX61_01295 [Dokdonia sinensis]